MATVDELFGVSYVELDSFKPRVRSLGVAPQALAGLDDLALTSFLAQASRLVEAHCTVDFLDTVREEMHRFDMDKRRISVNQPPVKELIAYKLQVAPQTYSTMHTETIMVNNQENYLELTNFSLAYGMTSPFIALGITDPQVIVQYKSYADAPTPVKTATSIIAADLINQGKVNSLVLPGLTSVKTLNQAITRGATPSMGTTGATGLGAGSYVPPPQATALLAKWVHIAAG